MARTLPVLLTPIRALLRAGASLLCIGLLSPLASLQAADASPSGTGAGIRVAPPPPQHAWLLPPTGAIGGNTCPAGDALSARWSPEGDYLVVDVLSRKRISLCLYDLSLFSFERNDRRTVYMHPLSTLETATAPASSARVHPPDASDAEIARLKDRLGPGGTITEWEASWAPTRIPGQPLALAFTRNDGSGTSRLYGLGDLSLSDTLQTRTLLGARFVAETFYQPAWAPLLPGDDPGQGGILSMVSSLGLSCGKSRIVYLPKTGFQQAVPQPLTTPCTGGETPEMSPADRYPVWDPRPGMDRLAFIRVKPGAQDQVCLLENARQPGRSRLRCDFVGGEKVPINRYLPAWSPDGRFLAYYTTRQVPSRRRDAPPEAVTDLELIDLQSSAPKPRVLPGHVASNPVKPPALLSAENSGHTWVLRIIDSGKLATTVTATRLDTAPGEVIERPLTPGLVNLHSLDVVNTRSGPWLAVTAQGYDRPDPSGVTNYKVFVQPISEKDW